MALVKRGLLMTAQKREIPQPVQLGRHWLKDEAGRKALLRPLHDLSARDFIAWTIQNAAHEARKGLGDHRIVSLDCGKVPGWAVREPPDQDEDEPRDQSNLLAFTTGLPSLTSGALDAMVTTEAKAEAVQELNDRLAELPPKRREVVETILGCYAEGVPDTEIVATVARRCGISENAVRIHAFKAKKK